MSAPLAAGRKDVAAEWRAECEGPFPRRANQSTSNQRYISSTLPSLERGAKDIDKKMTTKRSSLTKIHQTISVEPWRAFKIMTCLVFSLFVWQKMKRKIRWTKRIDYRWHHPQTVCSCVCRVKPTLERLTSSRLLFFATSFIICNVGVCQMHIQFKGL